MRKLILVLLLVVLSTPAHAIWDGHILPTLENGFDTTGLMILGAGSAATYGASTEDDHKYREWGNHRALPEEQTKIGDFLGTGAPGIAIALGQLLFDSENGFAHSEALIWSFLTTSAGKIASQKQRPNGLNRNSMPSGHTSTTFTTATHLTYAYGWTVGVPAYLLAAFTALTRVADDAHWYSDTVMGATIGIFWGRATYAHHSSGSVSWIEPMDIPDGFGVRYVYKF